MSSGIAFYNSSLFTIASALDAVDVFISDGTTVTYQLVNLTGVRVGSTIQAGNYQYSRWSNPQGFSVSGNSITLMSAPPAGTPIIINGTNYLLFQAFDQASAGGGSNTNIYQTSFYLADPSTINLWSYGALPTKSGIEISMKDMGNGTGASPSWVAFAAADGNGNPLTFGSPGSPIDFSPLQANDTLQSGISSGATSLTVANGSAFSVGRFIQLDTGNGTQETRRVQSISGNTLTLQTPTSYAHSSSATVFEMGIQIYAEVTIPINVSGGSPLTLRNLCPLRSVRWTSRV